MVTQATTTTFATAAAYAMGTSQLTPGDADSLSNLTLLHGMWFTTTITQMESLTKQ